MYCILPFEKDYYAKEGFDVSYFGHPLIDAKQNYEEKKESILVKIKVLSQFFLVAANKKWKESLKLCLTHLLSTDFKIVVACASNLPSSFYNQYKKDYPFAEFVFGKTYDLLSITDFAIVTSGTATLETAILEYLRWFVTKVLTSHTRLRNLWWIFVLFRL